MEQIIEQKNQCGTQRRNQQSFSLLMTQENFWNFSIRNQRIENFKIKPETFNILFNKEWTTTALAKDISEVDRDALSREYEKLRRCAPRRSNQNKRYFVRHDGKLPTAARSNRDEEHLAIALWNLNKCWPRLDDGRFRLLDYQLPLKARRSDKGIGKVDLLGVTDQGRLMVIELKVKPRGESNRGDSPAAALIQGLRYAAIVEANLNVIAAEVESCLGDRFNDVTILEESPIVQILAPKSWWRGWLELSTLTRNASGRWEPEFSKLTRDVEKRLGVTVECMALDKLADITDGPDGHTPQLNRVPVLCPVSPDTEPPIGQALSLPSV